MQWWAILLIALGAILLLILGISFYCFMRVFYSPKRRVLGEDEYNFFEGEAYEFCKEYTYEAMKRARSFPYTSHEIKTKDGLTLRGKFFELNPDAPIEIMLHGYRGTSERDLAAGIWRAHALGHSAFLYDHRGAGLSDGHVASFGILECRDLLLWVDYINRTFGNNRRLILTGISMGAATVMMAAAEPLPENVKYVIADCGYSSPEDIIKKVMRDMGLPAGLVYPFIRLGAILFGRFDPSSNSPKKALKNAKIPVFFVHGGADGFVPAYMSEENFKACSSKKRLVIIEGADHGLAYPTDKERYVRELKSFAAECVD